MSSRGCCWLVKGRPCHRRWHRSRQRYNTLHNTLSAYGADDWLVAISSGFVQNGAKVYITARRQQVLEEAAKEIGGDIIPIQGDVSTKEGCKAIADALSAKESKVDIISARWEDVTADYLCSSMPSSTVPVWCELIKRLSRITITVSRSLNPVSSSMAICVVMDHWSYLSRRSWEALVGRPRRVGPLLLY